MVIYLFKKKFLIRKIICFICLFILLSVISNIVSYIKFKDDRCVYNNLLFLENELLKKELDEINKLSMSDGVITKIIIRDMYSFYDEVVIDLGEDEVKENDVVVNNEGLVGIVYKVDKNRSYVKLLSGNYNISVKVGDTYGNLNKGIITMIDKYSEVKIGDKVYTSGLDEVLGGIYVGEVISVKLGEDKLGKEIKIKYIDNKYLNYVGVLGER